MAKKLFYIGTGSFIIHIKTKDFYKDISDDVEKRFDTSNYERALNRPLPTGKNNKVIGFMKDELGGKIMTKFVAYLMNDDSEAKKAKGTKMCII